MAGLALRFAPLCALAQGAHPLGPGAGLWEVEAPEDHGLDSTGLQTAKDYLFGKSGGITHRDCLVVIKDGALVYEAYSSEKYNVTGHQGYSATKTLGALIAGHAATYLGLDIDADITETYGVKSPKSYPVTSRQIMSQALAGADGPGEAWSYDAVGTKWINTMTEVIVAATGKKPSEIWAEHFQGKLGFDSLTFDDVDSVWATGSVGTCRDFARVGQLMLNMGRWQGQDEPIVGEAYMRELSTPQTEYAPYTQYANPCYGLLTWLTDVGKQGDDTPYPGTCLFPDGTEATPFPKGSDPGVFSAAGMFGQIVMALPKHNAVAVTMGFSLNQQLVPNWMYEGFCKGKVFEDCEAPEAVV